MGWAELVNGDLCTIKENVNVADAKNREKVVPG